MLTAETPLNSGRGSPAADVGTPDGGMFGQYKSGFTCFGSGGLNYGYSLFIPEQ